MAEVRAVASLAQPKIAGARVYIAGPLAMVFPVVSGPLTKLVGGMEVKVVVATIGEKKATELLLPNVPALLWWSRLLGP